MSEIAAPKITRDPPTDWQEAVAYEGPATQQVESRFEMATAYAEQAWGKAQQALDSLLRASINVGELTNVRFETPMRPTDFNVAEPTFDDYPADPESNVREPSPFNVTLPPLRAFPNAPTLNMPTFPSAPTMAAPNDPNLPAPSVKEVEVPRPPTLSFPEQPRLQPIPIPPKPDVQVPPWEGPDIPSSAGLDLPERQFEYTDIGDYVSNLLEQMRDKLLDTVINGGTGLHPDVEQALYDRSFIRLDQERLRRQQEAFNTIAGRGFNLPTGVLASTLTELENEFSRQLQEVNMDILVKQAELAQQNTHFALDLSHKIEAVLIQDWQVKAARLFEIASKEYQFFMDYYRARAEIYNLRLEGYKAYAQAYEARLRSELAKIEIYRGELEGAKLTAEVQKLGVDLYMTLIQAISVRVELYKSQMQAAVIELEIEKEKVEIYKTQYEAFGTRVAAFKGVWDAYGAGVSAAGEMVRAESLKVNVYAGEIDAVSKERASLIQGKGLELENHKLKIAQYTAELDKFKTEYGVFAAKLDAISKKNAAEGQKYAVLVDSATKRYTNKIQWYEAQVRKHATEANLRLEANRTNIETDKALAMLQIENLKTVASTASQIAASALGAVNASAQIGFSAGWSSSIDNSFRVSQSDSRSDQSQTSVNLGSSS